MNRISLVMLQNAVAGYAKALDNFGMLDTPLRFQRGSQVNGVPYSVTFTDYSSTPGIPNGRLGSTAREAYERLTTITQVLADMKHRNETL